MNVHPIFVHFPVALLTTYSVFELLRFKRLNNSSEWFYIKAAFVICGVLGAIAAIFTGHMAEEFHHDVELLVQTHEAFALSTTFIFGVISLNYIVLVLESLFGKKMLSGLGRFWTVILKLRKVIFSNSILTIAALVGLVSLTVTGALGGAIAFGPDIDPLAHLITSLLHVR